MTTGPTSPPGARASRPSPDRAGDRLHRPGAAGEPHPLRNYTKNTFLHQLTTSPPSLALCRCVYMTLGGAERLIHRMPLLWSPHNHAGYSGHKPCGCRDAHRPVCAGAGVSGRASYRTQAGGTHVGAAVHLFAVPSGQMDQPARHAIGAHATRGCGMLGMGEHPPRQAPRPWLWRPAGQPRTQRVPRALPARACNPRHTPLHCSFNRRIFQSVNISVCEVWPRTSF